MLLKRVICAAAVALALTFSTGAVLAKTRTVTLRVQGMSCGGCATAVERALKSTEGVEGAKVSYERGRAVVRYDDQKVTVPKLREVITNTGFSCDVAQAPGR